MAKKEEKKEEVKKETPKQKLIRECLENMNKEK